MEAPYPFSYRDKGWRSGYGDLGVGNREKPLRRRVQNVPGRKKQASCRRYNPGRLCV
jgi:hypothetical protein